MTTTIERFQSEHQDYNNLSADRRVEQVRVLDQLSRFAEKDDLLTIEASDIRAFLGAERKRGLAASTVAKKLKMIRPFYGWAWESKLIDAERMMEMRAVKAPNGDGNEGLPRPYSRKELDQFRAELNARWPTVEPKFWERWRRGTSPYRRIQSHAMRIQIEAIVALALHCGLRRQEIFDAAIDDIHYDNAYVVVRKGKGGKYREVPHTTLSRMAIRTWLELRAELKPKHDSLWLCLAWDDIKTQPMRWDRFRKLLRTIGDWQYHRFRHTAGTEWLRATKRIEIVQKLLGHSRVQQTLRYAELVRDDLHDAVAKAELQFQDAVGS